MVNFRSGIIKLQMRENGMYCSCIATLAVLHTLDVLFFVGRNIFQTKEEAKTLRCGKFFHKTQQLLCDVPN